MARVRRFDRSLLLAPWLTTLNAEFANTWEPEEQLLEDDVDIAAMIEWGKDRPEAMDEQTIQEKIKDAPPPRVVLAELPLLNGASGVMVGDRGVLVQMRLRAWSGN